MINYERYESVLMKKILLVVFLILVIPLLAPTLSRAGEGTSKPKGRADAPVKKPCFTLLNGKKIPGRASAKTRLATARVEVHVDGQTVREVITQLGRTIGVPVVLAFDVDGQEAWNDPTACERFDGTVRDVSARGYLDYLFFEMDFERGFFWSICEGKLVIFEGNLEPQPVTRVHHITKLFTPPKQGLGANATMDDLLESIKATVKPDSWAEVGGAGVISSAELAGAKVLVVRQRRDVQKRIAAMIATFKQVLAKKEWNGSRSILLEESRKRFRRAMAQKVTLNVKEIPLVDILASIEKQTKRSLVIDQKSLGNLGITPDDTLSYQGNNRSLRTIQDELLREIESVWALRFDMVMLTSREQVQNCPEITIFEVTDLLKTSGGTNFDYASLIDLISTTVEPESWSDIGGIGTMTELTLHGRAFLVVCQTEDVVEEIEQLFTGLRVIQKSKAIHYPPTTKEDRELFKKLKRKAKWHLEKGTTLSGFFTELRRKHGVESWVDKTGVESMGHAVDSELGTPIRVDNCSVKAVLDMVLDPLGLSWSVRYGRLLITSKEEAQCCLFTEIYEVSDLTVRADTQGNLDYDLDSLVDLVLMTVDPESWSEVGGGGTALIPPLSFGGRHVLVIRQTKEVHKNVAQLFADLRAAMPKDPAKRIPPVDAVPLFPEGQRNGFGRKIEPLKESQKLPKNLPPVDPEEPKLVESNNTFAIKLYDKMAKMQDEKRDGQVVRKSFCFSPYSIAALTQAVKVGTRGRTDKEIEKTLCLTLSGDDLHRAHGSLLTSLMSDMFQGLITPAPGRAVSPYFPRPFDLSIANRLWIQKEAESSVLTEFCKTLNKYYLCDIEEIDFKNHDRSAKRINHWVSKQTKQRITEIISPGDFIDPTLFIAVNTVFFQGTWKEPFQVSKNQSKPFYDSDGKTKLGTVPMMSMTGKMCKFGQVDDVSILCKSYVGDVSFMVLLPPPGAGELDKLQASLSLDKLRQWIKATKLRTLDRLELPKFKLDSQFPLIPAMMELGVKDLFNIRAADFSGMIAPNSKWSKIGLYVGLMRHKATIQVDEVGTVATAATVMGGFGGGMPLKPLVFVANRPFLFLILDEKTSSILFMGRYMGPDKDAVSEQESSDEMGMGRGFF